MNACYCDKKNKLLLSAVLRSPDLGWLENPQLALSGSQDGFEAAC